MVVQICIVNSIYIDNCSIQHFNCFGFISVRTKSNLIVYIGKHHPPWNGKDSPFTLTPGKKCNIYFIHFTSMPVATLQLVKSPSSISLECLLLVVICCWHIQLADIYAVSCDTL